MTHRIESTPEEVRRTQTAMRIRQRWGQAKEVKRYDGAVSDRHTADWLTSQSTADAELMEGLPALMERGQDLERNNPYIERYLAELEANVLGHGGMTLQMQCKKPDGMPDASDNKLIEDEWFEFNKVRNFDVTGEISGHEADRLTLRGAARDGNSFIRIHRNWPNRWGIALQLLESTWLDIRYSCELPNGNRVVMGVELDRYNKKVAYHFVGARPGERLYASSALHRDRVRVPAEEIIHAYRRKRVDQTVGEPWFTSVIDTLRNIDKYEEAEVLAARAEACKGGHYVSDLVSDTLPLDALPDPTKGGYVQDLSPGQATALPFGVRFEPYNPTHPNGNHSAFRKDNLRKAASGLCISYNMLANDLEGVNYSSLRGGLLDEREFYMMLQVWHIATVKVRIFEAWLESCILRQVMPFPMYKWNKFNQPHFQGRRWGWVDPLKDVMAAKEAIALNLTSRRAVISKGGEFVEDVFSDNAEDAKLAASMGIQLVQSMEVTPAVPPVATQDGLTTAAE